MVDYFKTENDNIIALPEKPKEIRINKLLGMFASGNLDASEPKTIKENGLGKWIEGFMVNVVVNLFGFKGKGDAKEWVYVSLLITDADHPKLRPGMLVHFFASGFEAEFFNNAKTEAEVAALYGEGQEPQVLRLEFDKSITTQYGSTIKPPTGVFREATEPEMEYYNAVQTILTEWSHKIPDPLLTNPPVYDNGELIGGLINAVEFNEQPVLSATAELSEPRQLSASK